MGKITFITGGARSGKSRYAEELLEGENDVLYIATAIPFDDEMKNRIELHRLRRNGNWKTVEAHKNFISIYENSTAGKRSVLIDCITIMVSNLMLNDNSTDLDNIKIEKIKKIEDSIENEISGLLDGAKKFSGETIIVSNELGMGLVPPNPLGRHYRDIAGKTNQLIAAAANNVYFMISGLPVKVKG